MIRAGWVGSSATERDFHHTPGIYQTAFGKFTNGYQADLDPLEMAWYLPSPSQEDLMLVRDFPPRLQPSQITPEPGRVSWRMMPRAAVRDTYRQRGYEPRGSQFADPRLRDVFWFERQRPLKDAFAHPRELECGRLSRIGRVRISPEPGPSSAARPMFVQRCLTSHGDRNTCDWSWSFWFAGVLLSVCE